MCRSLILGGKRTSKRSRVVVLDRGAVQNQGSAITRIASKATFATARPINSFLDVGRSYKIPGSSIVEIRGKRPAGEWRLPCRACLACLRGLTFSRNLGLSCIALQGRCQWLTFEISSEIQRAIDPRTSTGAFLPYVQGQPQRTAPKY